MQIVCMILCGLALLAAIFELILLRKEKKRNEKRNAAMVQLVSKEFEFLKVQLEALKPKVDNLEATVKALEDTMGQRLGNLEAGVVPDYEAARQAVDAVNDFNHGLTNILGYDPIENIKKARIGTGGDVEWP